MKLLETKEQLTLNELLRIAYEYGNDNADMPTDRECVEKEFSEWIETTKPLFKKLIIPRVSSNEVKFKFNEFISKQKDIDSEFVDIVNDNFWDLL